MPLECRDCCGMGRDHLFEEICEACDGHGYRDCDFCKKNYAVIEHEGEFYCEECWNDK